MSILGKWQQPAGQAFPGLWFQFNQDGTFQAEYPEMGITSSGSYLLHGKGIDLNQTQHSLGMTGLFMGLWSVEGQVLKLVTGQANQARPADLNAARLYERVE